ncbi:hypothetical protein G8J22_01350 [Lentilactobacillus hilgardii]|uniref:hypothetical protein n=1 Tax=Lentilactobacillus hilgardii TaxID=1588 RepID=UPI00019C6446|nr:hypothetical protein [Lentilactobacillus hilgardii]EEI18777.1 hypothetical protein HMPREF0497_2386 [Lentilactobacillus buchneri ATCC 11577]QIR09371.1 hypothetical protein G8J22_01350 [Lentilactobacillus hilgardii]
MDVKQVVSDMISLGGLGGLATLIGTIWAIIHEHKKDERQDDEDRRKLDDWLIQKVRETSDDAMKNMQNKYQDLKADFDQLSKEKDQMQKQLGQQIALKEEENRSLRESNWRLKETNRALKQENDEYRSKFGMLNKGDL